MSQSFLPAERRDYDILPLTYRCLRLNDTKWQPLLSPSRGELFAATRITCVTRYTARLGSLDPSAFIELATVNVCAGSRKKKADIVIYNAGSPSYTYKKPNK